MAVEVEGETNCFHCAVAMIAQQLIGAGMIDHLKAVQQLMQVAAEITESLDPPDRITAAREGHKAFDQCRASARKGFDMGAGIGQPQGHA